MRGKKNKYSEYVIICREPDRDGKIEMAVIDSGITEHLINSLIRMHSRDPKKRYFLLEKKIYQIHGPSWWKMMIMTDGINGRDIFELGIQAKKSSC